MLIDKMLVTSRDQEEILYIYILVAGMLSVVHFILSVLKWENTGCINAKVQHISM